VIRILFWLYRRTLALRRILRERLTPGGTAVLAGLFLVSFLAANPGQTLAYQAWVLLALLLGGALGFAPFFRAQVRLERRLPRFGTTGEPLRYRVRIDNLGAHRQLGLDYCEVLRRQEIDPATFVERLRPGRRRRSFRLGAPMLPVDSARVVTQAAPAIPAKGSAVFTAELVPLKRGPLHIQGAWLGRPDPLGLVRGLHRFSAPDSVMILPQRHPVAAGKLPGMTQYQQGGVNFAAGIGESEEFVGVREYRRGDSLRRVHWRVSARLGRPVVREYQDEYFVRHALVLDTFCDPSLDVVFEDAVAVAASFAYTVPDQESLLDLLFVGPVTVCVTAGRGVGNTEHMLEVLACACPCREPRYADLEGLVLRHSARMSGCLLVLLGWDEPRRRLVRRLKAMRIPVWAFLIQPPEAKPLPPPQLASEQPDRWVTLNAGRIAEGLRAL
jgi:uncharacterized protein (DUF58 family)